MSLKSDYYCIKCGAILNRQKGFNPNMKSWTCKKCGQVMIGDNTDNLIYDDVIWYCDGCGDVLNQQKGFTDKKGFWKCKNCGYKNTTTFENIVNDSNVIDDNQTPDSYNYSYDNISSDDNDNVELEQIYEEKLNKRKILERIEEENEKIESYKSKNFDDNDSNTYEDYKNILNEKKKKSEILKKISEEESIQSRELRKIWFRKNNKKVFITFGIFLLIICIIVSIIIYNKLIPIRYNTSDLIGENYKIVENKLSSVGFNNLEFKEIIDLEPSDKENNNLVSQILIGNKDSFTSNKKYFPNTKILIIYHSVKRSVIPYDKKALSKMLYYQVEEELKKRGFTNIKLEKHEDIILGWFNKDGEVEELIVDGNTNYDKNKEYDIDTEIIIKYHTRKNKK